MIDFMSTVVKISGYLAPVFTGAWVLIKYFFSQQKKIKELEADRVLSTVNSLKNQIIDHKATIQGLTISLSNTREELISVKTRLESNARLEGSFIKSVESLREETQKRIHFIESTLDEGEIVPLGNSRIMLRRARRGNENG